MHVLKHVHKHKFFARPCYAMPHLWQRQTFSTIKRRAEHQGNGHGAMMR